MRVLHSMETMSPPFRMKPIFEDLNGEISYDKIMFALAYYHREVEVD